MRLTFPPVKPAADRGRAVQRQAVEELRGRGTALADTTNARVGAAWDVLQGQRVGPPLAVRRWPWALGAAIAGALLGAAVAELARRVRRPDPPGAVDPEDVAAVIDRPR